MALALALCAAGSAQAAGVGNDPRLFALILANNQSGDPSQAALRYADDDAARFYELVVAAPGTHAELLADLDDDTQRTFPHLPARTRRPTWDNLRAAMGRLNVAMEEASRAGVVTDFYFFFAGHGDVGPDGEGFLWLADRRLSRGDLFREVLARSAADWNHVLIDACDAYFVLNRGNDPKAVTRALQRFLYDESLASYPNTGAVLSTANEAKSFEWAGYRSGVFSHQLLSALVGAGDVDGNRRVTYDELAAFVAAANLKVRDQRARLTIFARPPSANRSVPLFDLRRYQQPETSTIATWLTVPAAMSGHYYLEDDRGVRYADFNKSTEQPLVLALVERPFYYVRSSGGEARLVLDGGTLSLADVELSEPSSFSRGSLEESLRDDLFAFPFGQSFWAGYREAAALQPLEPEKVVVAPPLADPAPSLRPWAWGSVGLGAAALVTGAILQGLAAEAGGRLDAGSGITQTEAVALQRQHLGVQTGAGVAFGVGGAALVSAIVLFVLD